MLFAESVDFQFFATLNSACGYLQSDRSTRTDWEELLVPAVTLARYIANLYPGQMAATQAQQSLDAILWLWPAEGVPDAPPPVIFAGAVIQIRPVGQELCGNVSMIYKSATRLAADLGFWPEKLSALARALERAVTILTTRGSPLPPPEEPSPEPTPIPKPKPDRQPATSSRPRLLLALAGALCLVGVGVVLYRAS